MRERPAIIFDGDDTLWVTEPLYDVAREGCAALLQAWGLDPLLWRSLERETDLARYPQYGVSPLRFPGSCVIAARETARRAGVRLPAPASARLLKTASTPFLRLAPVRPEASDALARLRQDYDLMLLTRGVRPIQQLRLLRSGLAPFFEAVRVVRQKTTTDVRGLLGGRDPGASFAVGNDVANDLLPAWSCGLTGIWLRSGRSWLDEVQPASPQEAAPFSIASLAELPGLLHDLSSPLLAA